MGFQQDFCCILRQTFLSDICLEFLPKNFLAAFKATLERELGFAYFSLL
jgi:hypothetical protein